MEFQFRSEILDFIAASETILSPMHLDPPMTTEEKQLILVYVTELADGATKTRLPLWEVVSRRHDLNRTP